jgi:hypothetical protein
MIDINVDVVPVLPVKSVIHGECVAYGIVESGILVHYINRNEAKIIEWDDIVATGMKHDTDKLPPDVHEISSLAKE